MLGLRFNLEKMGPCGKNAILGMVDFAQISKKWPTLTMHISLNFDPKRVFFDFLESLGCTQKFTLTTALEGGR